MMADKDLLRLLQQGTTVWNQWRQTNPVAKPDLTGLSIRDLINMDLSGVDLSGAQLGGSEIDDVWLTNARLVGANLTGTLFNPAGLEGADLSEAWMRETRFEGCNLSRTRFHNARIDEAQFNSCVFTGADFGRSDLINAHFDDTEFDGVNFCHARMTGVVFSDVDFSSASGLESVQHIGGSTLGPESLVRSSRGIPASFLRGIGWPDTMIDYASSLVSRPIEFYSCFISHSSKDEEFVERIHADLEDRGVRNWVAPVDMKIGDKILDTIDKSIRLHDKLLLVLSENSVASDWVEDEVTMAFAEERRRNRSILFPIRIDDAVMETTEAWATKVRDSRHIGDFRSWKQYDNYKKSLNRLLRDLASSGTT